MNFRSSLAFPALTLVAFVACGKVDYEPVTPPETVLTVHHMGAYSSRLEDEVKEVQGTVFLTRWKLHWKKQGDGWSVRRRLDTLNGRGYHKLSMPNEVEIKADLNIELGADGIPRRISGYDTLHKVLSRMEQRESYRNDLLRVSDTVQLQARQRDLFRLRRFLPVGVLEKETPLNVEGINRTLETLTLDSARYQGERPRLELRCLEYEAYYHRIDSLPLLVEQFFFSSTKHRKWKHSTWSPGRVDGIRHFSVELSTGLPCFESLSETTRITLLDSAEKSEQPIMLYRYEEEIFNR